MVMRSTHYSWKAVKAGNEAHLNDALEEIEKVLGRLAARITTAVQLSRLASYIKTIRGVLFADNHPPP
ncbi:unnamed protein product [Cuscuta campestris]|uniref:Uncharacterized protein n=1 Tax=Cuscuta campestris TaxID=132261 RepID=A0A484MJG2_9ASTE|nr:unnamed protein product [Cuscuta campestris]VFQ89103.1 unnamed protein product [Cuscuta campestris]